MSLVDRPSALGAPPWQNVLRSRLMEQQAEAESHREIIDQYRRLAKTARDLKDRNRALLRGGAGVGPSTAEGPSPILSHLDAQLSTLRAELSTVYRTQAASQNRQLALSDALRDRDEEVRGLREEVRELRDVKEAAAKRDRDWDERWKVRTKDMETLNDEILSLNVELGGMTQNNAALKADNASLLQRWLDKMNMTADEMNHDFEKETEERGDTKKEGKDGSSREHPPLRPGHIPIEPPSLDLRPAQAPGSPSSEGWEILDESEDDKAPTSLLEDSTVLVDSFKRDRNA